MAGLIRLVGIGLPIRPDEAGFLLVARSWDPEPHSMYGRYFVDRPPGIIALVRLSDIVGGPMFIRVLGALTAVAVVLLAAGVAREVAGRTGAGGAWANRAVVWTAVGAAAVTSSALIDIVAAKGEILALPLLLGAVLLGLRAVRHHQPGGRLWSAAGAGGCAGAAVCLKQNLAGGLVFGAVLFVASWATGRIGGARLLRVGLAALGGACVPLLGTLLWAVVADVSVSTLVYDTVGFRSDAGRVLGGSTSSKPLIRALILVGVGMATGMFLVLAGLLVHLRRLWQADRALVAATAALLALDTAGLVLSGSFWLDYLFALVPATVLASALLLTLPAHPRPTTRIARGVLGFAAVSSVLNLVGFVVFEATGTQQHAEYDTGRAIAGSAAPQDTLVVFGGRADLQFTSGLPSPYPYLWSLPMRTLDPGYTDLRALVSGPAAPTWFVKWVPWGSWGDPGGPALARAVESAYVQAGTSCDGQPVYLHREVDRPPLDLTC